MITITLEGDEAYQYMQNEKMQDAQIEELVNELNSLLAETFEKDREISRLRAELEGESVSSRILADTEKAMELGGIIISKTPLKAPPKFKGSPTEPVNKPDEPVTHPSKEELLYPRSGTPWNETDFVRLNGKLKLPVTNQDRRLLVLASKLSRTPEAIRTKAGELGLTVKDNMIIDHVELDMTGNVIKNF